MDRKSKLSTKIFHSTRNLFYKAALFLGSQFVVSLRLYKEYKKIWNMGMKWYFKCRSKFNLPTKPKKYTHGFCKTICESIDLHNRGVLCKSKTVFHESSAKAEWIREMVNIWGSLHMHCYTESSKLILTRIQIQSIPDSHTFSAPCLFVEFWIHNSLGLELLWIIFFRISTHGIH